MTIVTKDSQLGVFNQRLSHTIHSNGFGSAVTHSDTSTSQPLYNAIYGVHRNRQVISELCYNEVTYSKIINLRSMTWLHYIENRIMMRRVIMRFKCIVKSLCCYDA